jgi:hypothetical protein
VFTKNAEPVDWLGIESRLQEISTSSPSHPSIGLPAGAPINPAQCAPGVISRPDIQQSAVAVFDLALFDRLAGNLVVN